MVTLTINYIYQYLEIKTVKCDHIRDLISQQVISLYDIQNISFLELSILHFSNMYVCNGTFSLWADVWTRIIS